MEFRGNGPAVFVEARLQVVESTRVRVALKLRAEETGGRGSRQTVIEGESPAQGYIVFTAPKGFRIRSARPLQWEFHRYIDTDPEPDVVSPACERNALCAPGDVRTGPLDAALAARNTSNVGLVRRWTVMGDTRGRDLGRTGVQVILHQFHIELEREK